MRKPDDRPTAGATRVVTKFLFWKKYLGGEMRWLERARIVQQLIQVSGSDPFALDRTWAWRDMRWAPEEPKEGCHE